jgi:hypothetical protein
MADSGTVDIKQLREEAARTLLETIKAKAAVASVSQLDDLALAYALVVGAAPGKLPGVSQTASE